MQWLEQHVYCATEHKFLHDWNLLELDPLLPKSILHLKTHLVVKLVE